MIINVENTLIDQREKWREREREREGMRERAREREIARVWEECRWYIFNRRV